MQQTRWCNQIVDIQFEEEKIRHCLKKAERKGLEEIVCREGREMCLVNDNGTETVHTEIDHSSSSDYS